MRTQAKPSLLIFIVAYNAEKTISWVLKRIPVSIKNEFLVEVLIIDDQSSDNTSQVSQSFSSTKEFKFPIKILYNPINQGYGGNQKLGYNYAIKNNFDFVALVHGDGQYPPEELPKLMEPFIKHNVDVSKNFDEVINNNNIDAVILATPNKYHEEQVVNAAKKGKQVFCEKPLALSIESARKMAKACDEAGIILGLGHERR